MRKEIEEEMKSKYQNKEHEKNTQNVKNEAIQYSEPVEDKTQGKPVVMKTPERQLTASELLQQCYNEMTKLKQQEKAEKIERFKSSMF